MTVQIHMIIQGYLRYETITSQNLPSDIPSEAQVKTFFVLQRKGMFRSRDIQVFVFLTIP